MQNVDNNSNRFLNNLYIDLPTSVITSTIRATGAVGGVALTALSIFPFLGTNEKLNVTSTFLLSCETKVISELYLNILKVVNPETECQRAHADAMLVVQEESGICGKAVSDPIFEYANQAAQCNDSLISQGVSRLSFLAGASLGTASRIADLGIGLSAGVVSIVPCLGKIEELNKFAIAQLNSFVLQDLGIGLRGFVNPQHARC